MSSSASTTGPPANGGKVAAPKSSEINRKSKIYTPKQLSTVQGFITSCLDDAVGSSLVGIRGLFRIYSFDLLENDALCKRQNSSLEKYETTIEGEQFIPQKFRYAKICYQRSTELEKNTEIETRQTDINIKIKELKNSIIEDLKDIGKREVELYTSKKKKLFIERGMEIFHHLLKVSKSNPGFQLKFTPTCSEKQKAGWLFINHLHNFYANQVDKAKELFSMLDSSLKDIIDEIFLKNFDGDPKDEAVIHAILDDPGYSFPIGAEK